MFLVITTCFSGGVAKIIILPLCRFSIKPTRKNGVGENYLKSWGEIARFERGLITSWHLFTQHKETQLENCFFFLGHLCRALKSENLLRSPRLPCFTATPLLLPPAWRPVPTAAAPGAGGGGGHWDGLLFPLSSPCLREPVAELTWEKASISYPSEAGAPTGTWAGSQRMWGWVGWQWPSAVELPGRSQEQLP